MPATDEVTLGVDLDGVSQVVDPSRGEVDVPATPSSSTSTPEPVDRTDCDVGAQRGVVVHGTSYCPTALLTTPYLSGVDWADDGRWLVAEVERPSVSACRRTDRGEITYAVEPPGPTEPAPQLSLDGVVPDEVVADGAEGVAAVVAWRVAEDVPEIDGRLRLERTVRVRSVSASDPTNALSLSWTDRVPDFD